MVVTAVPPVNFKNTLCDFFSPFVQLLLCKENGVALCQAKYSLVPHCVSLKKKLHV